MSSPKDQSDTADTWREDLWLHRKRYNGARWRWDSSHILDMTLELTGGRLDFTTDVDLDYVACLAATANEAVGDIQMAIARSVSDALTVLGSLEDVAEEETGLTLVELQAIHGNADVTGPPARRPHQVVQVTHAVREQTNSNPLIEILELTQVLRQYEAAAAMIDDVTWDLAVELRATCPAAVLEQALSLRLNIDNQIRSHRDRRGDPGDYRRIPHQVLTVPFGSSPARRSR